MDPTTMILPRPNGMLAQISCVHRTIDDWCELDSPVQLQPVVHTYMVVAMTGVPVIDMSCSNVKFERLYTRWE